MTNVAPLLMFDKIQCMSIQHVFKQYMVDVCVWVCLCYVLLDSDDLLNYVLTLSEHFEYLKSLDHVNIF